MNESTQTYAPRWLCIIAACLWIFPFTLASYLFKDTNIFFFLLLGYIFTFLCSFFRISASNESFEGFPGWNFAQIASAIPILTSFRFLSVNISLHLSPVFFLFLIIFLIWYFFLGQLPLIILYPISKFCVHTASKIYFSKNILLKLFSSCFTIILCCAISFAIFFDVISWLPSSAKPEIAASGFIYEVPRQGEVVSKESETVWIPTHGGTKYHRRSTCSGMEDPEETTKEDAIQRGFEPCQKCY